MNKRIDPPNGKAVLSEALSILEPYSPFLVCGILLGLCREGGFNTHDDSLNHDQDIDLGIFSDVFESDEITKKFLDAGWEERPSFGFDDEPHSISFYKNDIKVDILVWYEKGGAFYHYAWDHARCMGYKHEPFKLKAAKFLNLNVMIPEDPIKFLREAYGDWAVRKSNWNYMDDPVNRELIWEK